MNHRIALMLALAAPALLPLNAAPAVRLSPRSTILRGAEGKLLFRQCSRDSPAAKGLWNPAPRDIAAPEASLTSFLSANVQPEDAQRLASYFRQYAGFTRGRRKMIYLNAFVGAGRYWTTTAVVVCDGGSRYFGAVYDVRARKWSELKFNGPA